MPNMIVSNLLLTFLQFLCDVILRLFWWMMIFSSFEWENGARLSHNTVIVLKLPCFENVFVSQSMQYITLSNADRTLKESKIVVEKV